MSELSKRLVDEFRATVQEINSPYYSELMNGTREYRLTEAVERVLEGLGLPPSDEWIRLQSERHELSISSREREDYERILDRIKLPDHLVNGTDEAGANISQNS